VESDIPKSSSLPYNYFSIMAVLLTGGTGKTATCIADFLKDAKIPRVSAPCKGETKFDYTDSSTYDNPFKHGSISAVYLVAPGVPDPVPPMNDFIDFAVKKGVKRFVQEFQQRNLYFLLFCWTD